MNLLTNENADVVADVIKRRQTYKVLATDEALPALSSQQMKTCDAIVYEAIKTAGWAPFHYDRAADGMAEPWRVDFVGQASCRRVAERFFDWFDDVKLNNKLPSMLTACGSLVLVSWLPQFSGTGQLEGNQSLEKRQQIDEEHLAATAAYVQNLLLLLTAQGLGTYWSSGGQFRTQKMRQRLGVTHEGRLLAAVFVDYSPACQACQRLAGKQRDRRDANCGWLNQVDCDAFS